MSSVEDIRLSIERELGTVEGELAALQAALTALAGDGGAAAPQTSSRDEVRGARRPRAARRSRRKPRGDDAVAAQPADADEAQPAETDETPPTGTDEAQATEAADADEAQPAETDEPPPTEAAETDEAQPAETDEAPPTEAADADEAQPADTDDAQPAEMDEAPPTEAADADGAQPADTDEVQPAEPDDVGLGQPTEAEEAAPGPVEAVPAPPSVQSATTVDPDAPDDQGQDALEYLRAWPDRAEAERCVHELAGLSPAQIGKLKRFVDQEIDKREQGKQPGFTVNASRGVPTPSSQSLIDAGLVSLSEGRMQLTGRGRAAGRMFVERAAGTAPEWWNDVLEPVLGPRQ
jgi:hypothetical protein